MAAIPQISNPVAGKNYSLSQSTSNKQGGDGEIFDLLELTTPVDEIKPSSERESQGRRTGTESGDFLPVSVKIAKDGAMAAESLKQLINGDLLKTAKENGYTELYGELDNLTKTLFLKPSNIQNEILMQEKQNTSFSGSEFFNLLRELITPEGAEKALKTPDGMYSQSAVPDNEQPLVNNPHIHPMNTNITPSNNSGLDKLRIAVASVLKSINFANNKEEILTALSSNMKFLSKYLAPNKILSEELSRLSADWAKSDAAENFEALKGQTLSLLKNVSESLLNNEHTQVLIPLIVHNLSRFSTGESVINEHFSRLASQIKDEGLAEKLTAAFKQFISNMTTPRNTNTTHYYNNTTNQQKNQDLNLNSYEKSRIPEFLAENLADSRYFNSIGFDSETINAPIRSFLLGKIDGKTAINEIIGKLITVPEVRETLAGEIADIDSIDTMVKYLNNILRALPDVEERQSVFEGLVEIINNMAETNELPPESEKKFADTVAERGMIKQAPTDEKQTVMKPLVEFIEKNIDHSALKTINNYNASNLLQSLINAPGVFTPLAHYIVPLDIDGTKAFGELWVDKDGGTSRSDAGERTYHLFLTFDVEEVGRFEVNLIAAGDNVNLSLFHPESYSNSVDSLTKKVNRIIVGAGYTPKGFKVGVLKKPHDLTEVFPSLTERRTGFNVKA